jgi:hypothetical protein
MIVFGAVSWVNLDIQEFSHTEVEQEECADCGLVFSEECYECQQEASDEIVP